MNSYGRSDAKVDDRVDERDEPGLGEAGRDADHVLLGDADVEEAVGEALGERLERPMKPRSPVSSTMRSSRSASSTSVVANASLSRSRSTSASACAYSSSDIGQ